MTGVVDGTGVLTGVMSAIDVADGTGVLTGALINVKSVTGAVTSAVIITLLLADSSHPTLYQILMKPVDV